LAQERFPESVKWVLEWMDSSKSIEM